MPMNVLRAALDWFPGWLRTVVDICLVWFALSVIAGLVFGRILYHYNGGEK
jgi:hypothetical protein